MAEKLVKRSEVPVELTWDRSLIYKTDDDMHKDLEKIKALGDKILNDYKGKLNNADTINACMNDFIELIKLMTLVGNYTSLGVSVDYTDGKLQQENNAANMIMSEVRSKISFISVEIASQDQSVINEAIDKATGAKNYLKDILREKPHMLSEEVERVLAALDPVLYASYTGYETTKMADINFPDFEVDGKTYPLGYSLFEDHYEYVTDTKVRRAAFDAFSKKIAEYKNTTATYYQTNLLRDKIDSSLRGYKDVYEYLLFNQKVTREMYDRQMDTIMEKLAPHMRKYAKLLQRIHKLDKMTFADLKLAVDPTYTPTVDIKGAKDYCMKGLSILGDDYVDMIREAFDNRWIDFAQNIGKSTGGFCASPYGKNSYILLSYHGEMSDVFTLAHELGHAGHFKACNNAQSILDTGVSTYFVEAPSTMNELLMANYLKTTSDDKRFKRWVLSSQIQNTYFHNFVTHFMEAYYQREVYKIIDEGGSVQADTLSEIFKNSLEKFWGDAVEINDGAELTWMRQPHYYMGLYSYTYSAGLTVATAVARRIEKEGAPAVEDWKNVLRAGGTLDPVGLAALAKVDITTDKPLNEAIDYIGGIIDEIIKLTDELGE
ncbi:MAG: oligoendopeptidase F [Lachnospiraceae bacterium]|nr:oligoendopeptidase F [Lachnospiraceae bacterium]MBR4795665.1 oligoendopeptidase F [Lachnospiraceae bacterium]